MKKGCLIFIGVFVIFATFVLTNLISASNVSLIRNPNWYSNLSGVFHSSLALGDINGDNYSDLIAMGCTAGGVDSCTTADKIRVYVNNGTTFNENSTWEINTTNLGYGSLVLGDIDNNGSLDLVALGDKGGGAGIVRVYLNNGTSFDENLNWEQNISSIDAYAGSLALGDVDNDGNLDLALVGAYPLANNGIYINNGTAFVKDSNWLSNLPYVGHGLGMGSLAFADVNNDGHLDLAFAGSYSTNFYTNLYINNGTSLVDNSSWGGNFVNTAFAWPSLSFGDVDNDGDLDLTAIGTGSGGDKQRIYNNTKTNFTIYPGPSGTELTTFSTDIKNIHVTNLNSYWDESNNDAWFKYGNGDGGYIGTKLMTWLSNDLSNTSNWMAKNASTIRNAQHMIWLLDWLLTS